MENKFYTPSIEEFHVGFEYEELYGTWTDKPYWKKVIWTKDDFYNDHHCYMLTDAYEQGNLRVKYLDREDIESLGFKVPNEGARWQFENGVYKLYVTPYIYTGDVAPNDRITIKDGRDDHGYFDGIIKNKSELKRLLKQLGI